MAEHRYLVFCGGGKWLRNEESACDLTQETIHHYEEMERERGIKKLTISGKRPNPRKACTVV